MSPVVFRAGGRRAVHLLLLTGSLILGALGLNAIDANAATPSSLAGETFISHYVTGSMFTGACPGNSRGGSFNFSVSGTAVGPFPGTFTESGSITTSLSGHVLTFTSSFTIKNTAGAITVNGIKSLPTRSDSEVECAAGGPGGTEVKGSIGANYRATIPGVGQDSGSATVSIDDDDFGSVATLLSFSENFGSTGAPPPPTSKAQCKHGGWRSFGTLFKNQGDCVAFVATGGKNPPSGKGSLGAAPYTVCQSGCPFDDLQSAIEAVETGTITNPITVGPGDYPQTNAFVRGTVAIRGVGDGSNGTILDGVDGEGPVIDLAKPGNLTISGVEILDGNNDEGGGIFNGGATVTFDGPVSITNNAASVSGGGIFNSGGTVNFDAGSTVSITNNTARETGGGILNDGGTVNFATGSTVSITKNTAGDDGGGIFNDGGTVNFVPSGNVSITGNTPDNCVGTTSCR